MHHSIARLATDLAWSLWGELGVPSVVRNHTQVVVDPEPLVLAAPFIAQHDARLRDEIWRWCADRWTRASELEHLGYSKRNVARVLGDLAEAGLLRQRGERNSLTFRIANRAPWEHLLRTEGLVWIRWDLAFELVFALLRLEALTTRPTAVQRVEGTKLRMALNDLASSLDLPLPPQIRDREAPLDALLRWGEAMLSDLTEGLRSDPRTPSQQPSS